jgi:hypothetical protein
MYPLCIHFESSDGSYGDGKCNAGSIHDGNSNGSGKATKTTQQQQWQWGEIQQSTKKGMPKTAIATEMVMVADSNNNNVDANANDCALSTAMRMTRPECALCWWWWQQCQWWGGERDGNVELQIQHETELLCNLWDAWTFQVDFMYEKFL